MNTKNNLEQKHQYVLETIKNGILTIQFNHPHPNNPFSKGLLNAVTESLENAEKNHEVRAVILTGGEGRSFSVGGDFNETNQFEGGVEVEVWVDDIIKMYTTCLKMTKPTIAAVDKYAIGIGFQLALTCDWRIASDCCKFIMPELKNGIACTIGQYMLEKSLGNAAMMEIVYDCEPISLQKCFEYRLVNKITTKEKLFEEAYKQAEKLASYPVISFRTTKKVINEAYIEGLDSILQKTKDAHKTTFGHGEVQKFMKKIVSGEKK